MNSILQLWGIIPANAKNLKQDCAAGREIYNLLTGVPRDSEWKAFLSHDLFLWMKNDNEKLYTALIGGL